MRTITKILSLVILLGVFSGCEKENFGDTSFLESVEAPSGLNPFFNITQDNTGLVTITPNGEGATAYDIYFGHGSSNPTRVQAGQSVTHVYPEGTYSVKSVAYGVSGKITESTKQLTVSFRAPENLKVTIINDLAVSKQVKVTATADFAVAYDVYFGENANAAPVVGTIGTTVTYKYQNAGTYTIKVVAKSGGVKTTEYTENFVVTAILQPLSSAPTPPNRNTSDVISIFSDAYTSVSTDYFPDWGQGGQGSSWSLFDLNGDKMLKYNKLSYQGNQINSAVDIRNMQYLHMDVWTATDGLKLETSLISVSSGEKPVTKTLEANKWNSIDIPISAFTSQGLTVADIHQLKYVGDPWATGTVFIDNVYFYKPTSVLPLTFESGNLNGITFGAFDGGITTVVDNPNTTGNSSAKVLKLVKGSGQPWAGSKITSSASFDFTNSTTITAKVWSPRAGLNLLMKFEDATAWPNTVATSEIVATTTLANQWETLTFNFSGLNKAVNWQNLVLIMDNGTQGDGTSNYTIYVDDINLN
ncbi:MAG: hypothetical protein RI924_987 [Bacteroidota bacterium]|jgi:hypothetical protein